MIGKPLLTKSMQRRLANNPQQHSSVIKDVEDVFNTNIPSSKKPNARYGPAVFDAIMMGTAALGVSIFGYTAAIRRWKTASYMLARGHREAQCGEWISNICLRVDPYGMAKSLEKAMSANLERLQSLGLLSGKRIDIAIDMHLIRRWDRKHGAEMCAQRARARRAVLRGILQRSVSSPACRWYLHYCTCLHLRIQRVMCARPFQCAGEQVPKSEQSCLTESSFPLMSSECWRI